MRGGSRGRQLVVPWSRMGDAGGILRPVPNAKPRRLWWVYEAAMAALALAVVWLLTVPDEGWARVANLAIWAVFVVDYAVRLVIAGNRRRFVRSNIPDLIAILPLDFCGWPDSPGWPGSRGSCERAPFCGD